MADTTRIDLNLGTSIDLSVTWQDESGGAFDLADFNVEILRADDDLETAGITATITDAGSGLCRVVMPWASSLSIGVYSFSLRIYDGTVSHGSDRFVVTYC